jgi:hypothetical protein
MLQSDAARDRVLGFLDWAALGTFGAGIVISSLLGLAIAVESFKSQENAMPGNDKGKTQIFNDSFNKAANTRPVGSADLLQKSFNGAAKLKPEAAPAAPPPTTGGNTKQ